MGRRVNGREGGRETTSTSGRREQQKNVLNQLTSHGSGGDVSVMVHLDASFPESVPHGCLCRGRSRKTRVVESPFRIAFKPEERLFSRCHELISFLEMNPPHSGAGLGQGQALVRSRSTTRPEARNLLAGTVFDE